MVRSRFVSRLLIRIAGVVLLPAVLLACGGGDNYSVDEGRLAQRFLPTERTVDSHPDSLEGLTIGEEGGKISFELENGYASLVEKWSCSFQSIGAGQTFRSRTYATLWSLELSLASLQPEMGVLSLRKERARQLMRERRSEYFDALQIDVYWFLPRGGGDGIVSGPGARTQLHVGDSTYTATRAAHGPIREAFIGGGTTALYRRNTFYFPRTVNGTDVLSGATEVELEIREVGSATSERFTWRWEGGQTAAQGDAGRGTDVDVEGVTAQ